jgi:hypothetical protein
MMRLSASVVLGVVGVLLAGSGVARSSRVDAPRVLWQGPVLAGDRVAWEEELEAKGSLRLWTRGRGERVVYSSDSLDLGRPLAASADLLAFQRSYPSCPPQPNVVCPQAQDALAGRPTGPFKTLVPRHTCFASTGSALAVDAGVAAYLEPDCAHDRVRVVVRDVAHDRRPLVLRDAAVTGTCCSDVAIAGRFVAWNDRGHVVVYDRVARRRAYRATVRAVGAPGLELGFDLQPDGKLAVAFRLIEVAGGGRTTVAWFSPSEQRPHVLPLHGRSTLVRIARDRIAFERFSSAKKGALVVADLRGRVQTVARFAPPLRLRSGFDFDGRQIVWAQDRITATREDCPPPGQGRPCVLRETGVTKIWLRAIPAGSSHLVVRLPFDDTVAHPQP